MAGRPIKQGISYFPLDVSFFSDVKIRKIVKACGPNAGSVIICLLCNIYRGKGYYISWDEDLPFCIADEVGVSEGCVKEVLLKSVQVGFFDVDKYSAYGILTSAGIQKRFFEITKRRNETEVVPEFLINVDINSINVCNNSINVCNPGQSIKVKRKKEISPKGDKKKDAVKTAPLSQEISDSVDIELSDCKKMILSDKYWIEMFCMNNSINLERFNRYIDDFFKILQNRGETKKSAKDAKFHFSSWLHYEMQKQSYRNDRYRNNNPTNLTSTSGYGEE
jgi:hypothetical protein